MKLAFRKYMEFEQALGNKSKLDDLKKRVEEYLSTVFSGDKDKESSDEHEQVVADEVSEEEIIKDE